MNIPLSTFPAPLLRLILCGGKGLAPAWGPLPSVHTWKWSAKTGFCWGNGPRLPTLPEHLQAHPIVALLLALYDVPEIRARVESS